jgi:hypothetical protein
MCELVIPARRQLDLGVAVGQPEHRPAVAVVVQSFVGGRIMGFLRQCSQLSKLLKRKIGTIGGVLLYFLIIASGFVPYGLETFG